MRDSRACDSIAASGARLSRTQIRAYEPDDFEAIYRLDQACYPPGIAYSRYEVCGFLGLPGVRAWVAEEESDVVGFILVRQTARERGSVITLDVRADRRRRRVGAELLATAEEWLRGRGVRRVGLETAVNNEPAVAFWQRAGYQIVGLIPRYYLDRDDAYRMEKDL